MGLRLKRQLDERSREAVANTPVGKRLIGKPVGNRVIDKAPSAQIQQRFGDRVREVRQKRGISQEALADLCEVHRTFIGSVERGEANISLVNIYKIAAGLEISAKELMPDAPAEMPISAQPNQKRRQGGELSRIGSNPR